MKPLILTTVLWSLMLGQSLGQYAIAPTAFTLTYPERSTVLIVRCPDGAATMDFEMSAWFAVPIVDSLGTPQIIEMNASSRENAAPLLRFSPRRFSLSGGEEQQVRVTMTGTDTLSDGEYWSRLVASAKLSGQRTAESGSHFTARMGLEIRTVLGFIYRKGSLTTSLDIHNAKAWVREDTLWVSFSASRGGTAAWIGTLEAVVGDEAKQGVGHLPVAIYRNGTSAYAFSMHDKPWVAKADGLRLRFLTRRDDHDIRLIQAPPVEVQVRVGEN